nr:hypothetical protein GCM10020093_057440 [Planobispora longispora]
MRVARLRTAVRVAHHVLRPPRAACNGGSCETATSHGGRHRTRRSIGGPDRHPAYAEDPVDKKISETLADSAKDVRVIVEVKSAAKTDEVAEAAEDLDSKVVLESERKPFIVVSGDGDELTELAKEEDVVSIREDRVMTPSTLSSLAVIGADKVQQAGITGEGQAVAFLDTGIDRGHPAFAGRIVAEACFSPSGPFNYVLQSLCPDGGWKQTGPGSADATTARCLNGTVNLCAHGTLVAAWPRARAPARASPAASHRARRSSRSRSSPGSTAESSAAARPRAW